MRMGRFTIVIVAAIAIAACGGDNADSTTTTAAETATSATEDAATSTTGSDVQSQPEGASSFFSIEEIGIDPDGWVALLNFTDVPVTLEGLHMCQAENCVALPNETVDPGQRAYIVTGDAPDVDGVIVDGLSIGPLAPSDGELALFVTDPSDATNIIAYLEWGSAPHALTDAAIAAGLWLEDSYAPSGDNAIRLYRNPDSGLWLWDAAS